MFLSLRESLLPEFPLSSFSGLSGESAESVFSS